MFCTNCGAKLDENAAFCTSCGKKITQDKEIHPHTVSDTPVKQQNSEKNHRAAAVIFIGLAAVAAIFLVIKIIGVMTDSEKTAQQDVEKYAEIFRTEKKDGEDIAEDAEAVSEVQAVETEETLEDTTASVEVQATEITELQKSEEDPNASRIIEDQSFEVTLRPFGEVSFISYEPESDEVDATFEIWQNGDVKAILLENSYLPPGFSFLDVNEVFFLDYNADGVDDILINIKYLYDEVEHFSTYIYRGSAEGDFYLQSTLGLISHNYAVDGSIYYYQEELLSAYQQWDLPYSNTNRWEKEDLQMLTVEQLRLARNEIYARHGYIFSDETLSSHFLSRDWYEPSTTEVPDTELSDAEIYNRDLILELEEEKNILVNY